MDNLLFGRVSSHEPRARAELETLVEEVLESLNLKQDVMLLIAESDVGIRGAHLTNVGRQTVPLARCLFKRPQILVLHDTLSAFDGQVQARMLGNIRDLLPQMTIVWIVQNLEPAIRFDRVIELADGGLIDPEVGAKAETPEVAIHPGELAALPEDEHTAALEALSKLTLIGELDPAALRRISLGSRKLTVPAGQYLYRAGDEADAAYLLVGGEAECISGREPIGRPAPKDELIGALETISERTYSDSVRATSRADVLRIGRNELTAALEQNAKFAVAVIRSLAGQLVTDQPTSIAPS
jgi:putative ABC transport system ATP-binding protein